MASIVTFQRNSVFQEQVIVRFYDDSSGLFVEQTRLEIQYGEYEALSLSSGFVSVRQKSTLEYLLYEQPFDFYRMDSVGFPIWGPGSTNTVSMLAGEIGGGASGSTPPPSFAFTQFLANGTTITPDTTTDILTITPGTGISITGNAISDTITFANTGILGLSTTLPITRSLGSSPTIGIEDATTSSSGAMSASDKTKLDGIAAGAEVNVNADWNAVSGDAQILNKPTIVSSVSGTAPIVSSGGTTPAISITDATTSSSGAMSAADKTKLDGIAAGAEVNVNADWNAVSGDAQILNKPTIPAQYSFVATNSTTTYPLVIGDANEFMVCDSTSNFTITIPLNSSVPFATGTEIAFMQANTGSVTIQGNGGVTLRTSQTAKTAKQYAVIAIKKIATDTWVCVGDRQAL